MYVKEYSVKSIVSGFSLKNLWNGVRGFFLSYTRNNIINGLMKKCFIYCSVKDIDFIAMELCQWILSIFRKIMTSFGFCLVVVLSVYSESFC